MRNEALVSPELIRWARVETKVPIEEIASATSVTVDQVQQWEEGTASPTLRQLRLVAKKCHIPFAAFYLPEPPDIRIPKMRDYRNIGVSSLHEEGHILNYEIRHSLNLRSVLLETIDRPVLHDVWPKLNGPVEKEDISQTLRALLNITYTVQSKWRDSRIAFNYIRNELEKKDVLIFQTSDLETDMFRALSLFFEEFPIVLVNRKDSYSGRIFSILHELTHICLRSNAICDLSYVELESESDRSIEQFCNAVAAEVFVPNNIFLNHFLLRDTENYDERIIEKISKDFCCSKEVIARKMFDNNMISRKFYEAIREKTITEYYEYKKKQKGFVLPATDVISLLGRRTVGNLISAVDLGKINIADFSEYTGLRLKHFEELRLGV